MPERGQGRLTYGVGQLAGRAEVIGAEWLDGADEANDAIPAKDVALEDGP